MPKYKKGDIVTGKVTGIENYGIFLLLENDNYTGLIHISEISEKFVKNVFDYVRINEIIKARVLNVDDLNHKLKLSIKDFNYRIEDITSLEDENGFNPLKKKLPEWISEYKMMDNK